MAEAKEVTIKLDDLFTGSVCDYSVGFLRFTKGEKAEIAEPMGTGTFVKIGRIYGILTAAHVLDKLDPQSTVGLSPLSKRAASPTKPASQPAAH